MSLLFMAHLPGVGFVENLEPHHYRQAIDWLGKEITRQPIVKREIGRKRIDPRCELRLRLCATLRRIGWHAEARATARAA